MSQVLGKTNNRLLSVFFQNSLDDWAILNQISNINQKRNFFNGFLNKFKTEIINASKNHQIFVITSEHFHSRLRSREEIQKLHAFLTGVFEEIQVVCYFREQFDLAISLYSTAIRNNYSIDLDTFIEKANPDNYYYNYEQIAKNWSEIFGKNNCDFRIYDKTKFISKDLRLDFLQCIKRDINPELLNMDISSSNEALFLLQSVAITQLNRVFADLQIDDSNYQMSRRLAKETILELNSLKLGKIKSSKAELIRNRFKKSNAIFFKNHFDEVESFSNHSNEEQCKISCDEAAKAVKDVLEVGIKLNANFASSLTKKQIDSLREIALHLYNENDDYLEFSLVLMKIALSQRPDGKLIREKVKEWSKNLENIN